MMNIRYVLLLWFTAACCIGTVGAVEFKPYVGLGVGAYQLDINVDGFGASSAQLPSAFLAVGFDMDMGLDFDLGIQLRAGGSEAGEAVIANVSALSQVDFPLYSLYLVPQYKLSEAWKVLGLLGMTEPLSYTLTYASGATISSPSPAPLSYGLAIEYQFEDGLKLGLEWMSYQSTMDVSPSAVVPMQTSLSGIALTVAYRFSAEATVLPVATDTAPPQLYLLGDAVVQHILGAVYADKGATAVDDIDGDISQYIVSSGFVDIDLLGDYTMAYDVQDSAGNKAMPIGRQVQVIIDPLLEEKIASLRVSFASNSSYFMPSSKQSLKVVVALMQQHPWVQLEVGGHTDSLEDESYNTWLSKRRAARVMAYLIRQGVAADRLVVNAYHESQPQDDNKKIQGRANNRRVEFRLLGGAD